MGVDDAKEVYAKELRVAFGRALRRQRRDLDLPQQAIADRSGLSKRAVCQVERASVDTHLGTLAALALAVGLDVPSMLRGRTEPAALAQVRSPFWKTPQLWKTYPDVVSTSAWPRRVPLRSGRHSRMSISVPQRVGTPHIVCGLLRCNDLVFVGFQHVDASPADAYCSFPFATAAPAWSHVIRLSAQGVPTARLPFW